MRLGRGRARRWRRRPWFGGRAGPPGRTPRASGVHLDGRAGPESPRETVPHALAQQLLTHSSRTQSIGILLFGPAAGTTVAEDATSANDIGIYNFGDNSSIDTNRVLSHRFEGIVLAGQPPGAEVILDWGSRH